MNVILYDGPSGPVGMSVNGTPEKDETEVAFLTSLIPVFVPEAYRPSARVVTRAEADAAIAAAEPAPSRIFSKRKLFLALTDAEYDTFAAIEAQQKPKARRAFAEAVELNEADADFPIFRGLLNATYGEVRASALLDAAAL